MKTHNLKLNTEYWDAVMDGEKTAELRINDRDYQKGDLIVFNEHKLGGVNRVSKMFIITHVLTQTSSRGMDADYCVISIKPAKEA